MSIRAPQSHEPQIPAGRSRPRRRLPLVLTGCVLGLAVAGCGGASSGGASSASSSADAGTPAASASAATTSTATASGGSARRSASHSAGRRHRGSARIVASHDRVTKGTHVQRPVSGTGGATVNDDNPGAADAGASAGRHSEGVAAGQPNPCALVPEAAARAAVGGLVGAPVEAPLGPTCIYRSARDKSYITVTVEAIDFSQVKAHMHHTAKLSVQGRAAYCGNYGRTMTFVPLSGRKVLSITAPCGVGRQLATLAIPRLTA